MGGWLGVLLAFFTVESARPITNHRLAFFMVELARTDEWTTGFLQERVEVGASPFSGFLLCAWIPNRTPGPKSETQCLFIEVLKPQSWERNPVSVCQGPETQVLRAKYQGPETQVLKVKLSVRLSRSWNPGPESQISRSWNPSLESETQCPFIEVLKPRSWEPNAATRACRQGRIVSDHHGYPLVPIVSSAKVVVLDHKCLPSSLCNL